MLAAGLEWRVRGGAGRGWRCRAGRSLVFVAATLVGVVHLSGVCCCGKASRTSGRLTLLGQGVAVQTVVFGPDGGTLGSVGADGSVAVWDLDSGLGRPMPPAGPGQGHFAGVKPRRPVAGDGPGRRPVALYDLGAHDEDASSIRGGDRRRRMPGLDAGRPHPGRGPARRADLALGRRRRARAGGARARRGRGLAGVFARRPDARLVGRRPVGPALGLGDRPRARRIPGQPGMFVGLAFSPDGHILAMADHRGRHVRLWDLEEVENRPALHGAEVLSSPWRSSPMAAPSPPPTTTVPFAPGISSPAGSTRRACSTPASRPWPSRPTAGPWPPAGSTAPSTSGTWPRPADEAD